MTKATIARERRRRALVERGRHALETAELLREFADEIRTEAAGGDRDELAQAELEAGHWLAAADRMERAGEVVAVADLADLRRLARHAEWVERRTAAAVGELRRLGVAWQDIADVFGLTREGARRRWGR